MAFNLVRQVSRRPLAQHIVQRALGTSAVRLGNIPMKRDETHDAYCRLGNREIVGHGMNEHYIYEESFDYPCPAITFQDMTTAQMMSLREKEKGDWNNMSVEEKKVLYRGNFRCTYAEMTAPTGEWKSILNQILVFGTMAFFAGLLVQYAGYTNPKTHQQEYVEAEIVGQLKQHQAPMLGYPAGFDYEKKAWK